MNNKKVSRLCKGLMGTVLAGVLAVGGMFGLNDITAQAAGSSDEIMLGVFWTSDEDNTDTLYYSTDGENFYELCEAYTDATPNDSSSSQIKDDKPGRNDSTLHDPSIIYRDGYFWMLSGFTSGEGSSERFIPMMGYSTDLVHWTYPGSGSRTNVELSDNPPGSEKYGNKWDMVAPDFMVDDDGTVYIIASFGYYAMWHNDNPENDIMKPYIVKVSSLTPGEDAKNNIEAEPTAVYEKAVPINLPCMTERSNVAHDHIDGSLYKEDGYYYLSVKENGVTNEIWRIKNLDECSDSSKWELVCDDAVTGYEGPSLTKYQGEYFLYMDRLSSYTPVDSKTPYGSEGIWVAKASTATTGALDKYTGWLEANVHQIHTYGLDGNEKANRHGTVITLTGDAAKVVRDLAESVGYKNTGNTYNADNWAHKGWYYKESYRSPALGGKMVKYWYEDDVRQGVNLSNPDYRGKEIYDPDSDAWYWLDAVYDGKMAVAENGYEGGDYEVAQPVDQDLFNSIGAAAYGTADWAWKWVRYDWQGKMIKATDENLFYLRSGTSNWYRYDPITGEMVKGAWSYVNGNGHKVTVFFDTTTGIRVDNQTREINGISYTFDENGVVIKGDASKLPVITLHSPADDGGNDSGNGGSSDEGTPEFGWYKPEGENGPWYWYENGVRQGYDPNNRDYRGKEIYDLDSDAWYWLDNVQDGARAVSKDVFQESGAGEWAENEDGTGKWVRYDENGHMIKGWSQNENGRYYFDLIYGTMAKGTVEIDGETYTFDENTGILQE